PRDEGVSLPVRPIVEEAVLRRDAQEGRLRRPLIRIGGTMIETRKLGQGDVRVGAIALGAMAFAGWYDTRDDEGGVLAIHRALDAGITLIDTAEAYGNGKSEGLVGRAVRDRRDQAVVATKASKGSPAYLREAVDRSLKHLGLDHIDLYYLHRVDPD